MKCVPLLLFALCALPLCAAAPPNVVLILLDDMGYGDLKAYNPDSKIATPAIDRLAAEGMKFTDAHSTGSTCIPARFGLLTGTYPFRQPSMRDHAPLIPKEMPTLATILKSAGYQTAMVGKWHLGFTDKTLPVEGTELRGGPVDRGFDSFFGIHASTDIPPYYYIQDRLPTGMPMKQIAEGKDDLETTGWNHIQGAFWRKGGIGQDLDLPEVTPRFFKEAVDYLGKQSNAEKPFFLYLALPSPHTPWLPTKEFIGKSGAGSYGDFVMTVDHGVGQVLAKLDEIKATDDTLVLLTSDNGPVWYWKDIKKYDHDSVAPLRGMKADNWEAGHRIPFIVRYPRQTPAGSTCDTLISFLDVAATLGEIAGQKEPAPPDSISFLPSLLGKENPKARSTLIHGKKRKYSIRENHWKLIMHRGSGGFSKVTLDPGEPLGQLYDLENDLGEKSNLWRYKPEVVEELSRKLKKTVEP